MDDFCLISTHKAKHQKAIDDIEKKICTMGMKIKPSKCRSLTISKGKPQIIHFKVGNNSIPSIAEEEQKFLGKVVFFSGKQSESLKYIQDKLNAKLERRH